MIAFSTIYGIISLGCAYYGEMITYLGMTLPMAILALVSWLGNPYNGKRSEVRVNRIGKRDVWIMTVLAVAITIVFYYILKLFNTANLIPSTLSVLTSFVAVYLSFRRSAYYALAYATNDVVLIVLWIMATVSDVGYISVVVCFVAFLVNDLYGFFNWLRMQRRQA